jgi:hypothetical protein
MKTVRKVVAVMLFVAPMFVPVRSKAEGFSDFLRSLFRDEQQHRDNLDNRRDLWQRPDPRDPRAQPTSGGAGNSVPLDGGMVFLLAAGLVLGAGMVYSRNRRVVEVEPA